ncbi:AbrB/MazE/SpoVT family DNA-binding domain-containing protein [bacterium]|nr:AbrB/MazE/SpoVT family DNA-binding domain-containing protein [bacterium]
MVKTTVTKKGQTVVPAEIRKKFQIKTNSKLIWTYDDSLITVVPAPDDPIRSLRGFSAGKALRQALLKSRKEDEK